MRKFHRDVVNCLREHGATDVRVEWGGKHPKAVYNWHGQHRFCVMPGTCSDGARGLKNAVAFIRRTLRETPIAAVA